MKSVEIRQKFLDFFASKQHQVVSSAPMVIKGDPTLMFTNAGMNQFKDLFLGHGKIEYPRITDTQKCLRVSGKHNDLEEVGYDSYHHTMFEMLGNWSFGDYFKKEAINWAWELLTEVYKIDKSRLYVSVFEGDKSENLNFDQEAFDLWKSLVDESHIINGNKKDNFWEMGDTGPCGPCSEIHMDMRSDEERAKVDGASLVNMDDPDVIEIWNLVFMQYNRKANGSLENLPNTHVDTGMGFERLARILQSKDSNYDTDVFQPLIQSIAKVAGVTYGKDEKTDIAIRVIADHCRAVSFAIADGQLPSNTGAGYVIRRILRRAVRYGFSYLNISNAFIFELTDILAEQMGATFPELVQQRELVKKVIQEEEHSFLRTLDKGLRLLDDMMAKSQDKNIAGDKAFELYDTFGFPIDLTRLIAQEKGYTIDQEGFEKALEAQKDRARKATAITADDWVELQADEEVEFIGYDALSAEVRVQKYRKVVQKKKTLFQIVLNKTPFYPEGGGQVGDSGTLISGEETIHIFDTKKENNLIVHYADKAPASDAYKAQVNEEKRKATESNHSATHLLHFALREILGTHVEQKGSLVHPDYLRFDFSHFSKLSSEELKAIENRVNDLIRQSLKLEEDRSIAIEDAKAKGAMALFGEKYGDKVRAIQFGDSIELCGGTHAGSSAEIFLFKIVSEGAVAAGIRRIEAITSQKAFEFFDNNLTTLDAVKQQVKNVQDPLKAIENIQSENSKLKKQVEQLLAEKAKFAKLELLSKLEEIDGVQFLAEKVDLDAASVKSMLFEMEKEKENVFALLASNQDGKAVLSVMISKNLVDSKGLHAGTIVRELGRHIQGGGGGQANFATAGGKNPGGIPEALEAFRSYIK
jgi:alanyl-tRNA synthetase